MVQKYGTESRCTWQSHMSSTIKTLRTRRASCYWIQSSDLQSPPIGMLNKNTTFSCAFVSMNQDLAPVLFCTYRHHWSQCRHQFCKPIRTIIRRCLVILALLHSHADVVFGSNCLSLFDLITPWGSSVNGNVPTTNFLLLSFKTLHLISFLIELLTQQSCKITRRCMDLIDPILYSTFPISESSDSIEKI